MPIPNVRLLCFAIAGLVITACSDGNSTNEQDNGSGQSPTPPGDYTTNVSTDFSQDSSEWTAGFADYPEGGEDFYELTATPNQSFSLASGGTASGYLLHSKNYSDDTKMYLSRQVTGLKPGAHYDIAFEVEIATNVASGCFGIGGAPSAVTIKAGLHQAQIDKALDSEDHYRVNVDFGNQSKGGLDGLAMGDIGEESLDSCDPTSAAYALKTFDNTEHAFEATADDQGNLWLTLMTDSGFEGNTTLYFTKVEVEFEESDKSPAGFTENIDFSQHQPDVKALFFDYPTYDIWEWELDAQPETTVTGLAGEQIKGYKLHSINHSDDIGMLLHKPVKGLAPNTQYQATFAVEIAGNVNDQCGGIGGPPHSVAVKAGLSLTAPDVILPDDDDHFRLNVDFGNQMNASEHSVLLGDIGIASLPTCDPGSSVFARKAFNSSDDNSSVVFTTNDSGVVYFSVLTDSGFEGVTTVLFTQAEVTFTRL